MNRIISVIILIFCLFCFSCETLIQPDDRERKINDIETPFDFSTAREVDVTIKAENEAGEAVSRVYFELLKDEHLLSTGQTNNTGEFNSTIVIPTYLQSLTIRSRAGQKEVSVTNGDIDYTYKIDNKTNNSTNSLKKNTAATCYSYNVHYTQEIRNSCIKFEDAGYWPGEWEEDPLGEDGLVETDIFIIKVQDSVETINLTLKAGPSTEEVTLNGVGDSKSALGFECTFVSRSYAWWETYQYKIGITSDDVKGRGRWGTKALSNVEFCFGNGSTVDQADYWTKRYSGCTQEAPDGIDNDYDGFIDEGFEDLDADNDGVVDANDAYPDDPEKAFNNYYPDKDQFGTLAYEDKWPIQGDYDFNDLIIGYNFNHVVKNIEGGTNQVVQIDASLVVRATGARYENGFG
ncbi:MAG: LruC domain-containing protein, partial [Candidatus Marinimicrobia bacterium]|nr:LruC domain-containing protein [Candidatus Neomarinimicrobiota bacterium]